MYYFLQHKSAKEGFLKALKTAEQQSDRYSVINYYQANVKHYDFYKICEYLLIKNSDHKLNFKDYCIFQLDLPESYLMLHFLKDSKDVLIAIEVDSPNFMSSVQGHIIYHIDKLEVTKTVFLKRQTALSIKQNYLTTKQKAISKLQNDLKNTLKIINI